MYARHSNREKRKAKHPRKMIKFSLVTLLRIFILHNGDTLLALKIASRFLDYKTGIPFVGNSYWNSARSAIDYERITCTKSLMLVFPFTLAPLERSKSALDSLGNRQEKKK